MHDGIIGGGLFLNAAFNSNTWDAGYFLSGDHTNPSLELVPEDYYDLTGLSGNPENGRVYRFFNMTVDVEENSAVQEDYTFRLFQKSNDELSLLTPEGNTKVEVRGITGQLIEQFTCNGNMNKNISDYAPGIYLVHFEMNGVHKTLRFVKN
ncbi:MAG: T9SS type A sorting domain-containing protein [Flavobacteriales bacterium]|nr:T9SS type A sorting domain-containing protein [Flavobacteriales bacterium]